MRFLVLLVAGFTACGPPPVFVPRGPEPISVVFQAQHELGKPYPSDDDRAYEEVARKTIAALERDPRVHVTVVEQHDAMPASFDYLLTIELDSSVQQRSHCVDHSTHIAGAIFDGLLKDDHNQRDVVTCNAMVQDPPLATASILFRIARHMPYNRHSWPKLTKKFFGPKVETDDVQPLVAARIADATAWIEANAPTLFPRS
jgi:hypothetical protein